MSDVVTTGGNSFVIEGMAGAMKLAQAMAGAKMVPQHLQGSPGDCLMVIEQAMRWQMSPFAVAQATAVVRGKLCFEGKLVAAAIQASGVLSGRLDYAYEGERDGRRVIVSGHIRGEAQARTIEVSLKDARTDNQWWTKTPDQMLAYHGARVWARRHTPEVMLGVYAPDEFDETPQQSGTVIDVTPQPTPTQQIQQRQERPTDYVEMMRARLEHCTSSADCEKLWKAWESTLVKAEGAGRPIAADVSQRVNDMIAERSGELSIVDQDKAQQNAAADADLMPA